MNVVGVQWRGRGRVRLPDGGFQVDRGDRVRWLGEVDRGGRQFKIIDLTAATAPPQPSSSAPPALVAGQYLDDELRSDGIATVPELIKNWDTGIAVGGPIIKDRLWFFNDFFSDGQQGRRARSIRTGTPATRSAWVDQPDTNVKSRSANVEADRGDPPHRPADPKNKLGFDDDYEKNCADRRSCPTAISAGIAATMVALGAIGGFGPVSPSRATCGRP